MRRVMGFETVAANELRVEEIISFERGKEADPFAGSWGCGYRGVGFGEQLVEIDWNETQEESTSIA